MHKFICRGDSVGHSFPSSDLQVQKRSGLFLTSWISLASLAALFPSGQKRLQERLELHLFLLLFERFVTPPTNFVIVCQRNCYLYSRENSFFQFIGNTMGMVSVTWFFNDKNTRFLMMKVFTNLVTNRTISHYWINQTAEPWKRSGPQLTYEA